MTPQDLPSDAGEWDALPPRLIRSALEKADMNYVDLVEALARFGVSTNNKIVSSKMRKGRFSATFLLQALVACGATELPLPPFPRSTERPTPLGPSS